MAGVRNACVLAAILLIAAPFGVMAADQFRITENLLEAVVQTEEGPVVIKRGGDVEAEIDKAFARTCRECPPFCIQPMTLAPGVTTVGEVEVIEFLKEGNGVAVDARIQDLHWGGTIPGAINIPHDEMPRRLDELGCRKAGAAWDCSKGRQALVFCNGPWCFQSPTAIRTMLDAGYPAARIYYYRGGMQVWKILGLTTVEGSL